MVTTQIGSAGTHGCFFYVGYALPSNLQITHEKMFLILFQDYSQLQSSHRTSQETVLLLYYSDDTWGMGTQ